MHHTKSLAHNPFARAAALSLLTMALVVLSTSDGHATAVSVGGILCAIFSTLRDDVGRGIATLAVASLGISAMVGKVSWGMAIMVAVGIAVLFGAAEIVDSIPGVSSC